MRMRSLTHMFLVNFNPVTLHVPFSRSTGQELCARTYSLVVFSSRVVSSRHPSVARLQVGDQI